MSPMPSTGWQRPAEDSPCVRKNRTGLCFCMACKNGKTSFCDLLSLRLEYLWDPQLPTPVNLHHSVLTCSISLLLKYPPGALTILCTFAPAGILVKHYCSVGLQQSGVSVQSFIATQRHEHRKDAPILSAISATRSPQIPLMATSTFSPGSTVLNTAHSMAAWPEPLMQIVMLFSVWKAYWMPFLMSFMIWIQHRMKHVRKQLCGVMQISPLNTAFKDRRCAASWIW